MAKVILSPALAAWQIDLNSPFREPQDLSTLRNSDQIDSVNSASSVRAIKTLLGVEINSVSSSLIIFLPDLD